MYRPVHLRSGRSNIGPLEESHARILKTPHCKNAPAGSTAPAGDIELVDFEQYGAAKMRIACVDVATRTVYLTGPTAFEALHPAANGFKADHRYLIENMSRISSASPDSGSWTGPKTPWNLQRILRCRP